MKRFAFLLIFLAALSAVGLTLSAVIIHQPSDRITFTETTHFGDKSAADGLTVTVKNTYDRQLFWDTTFYAGEEDKVTTDYRFYSSAQRMEGSLTYGGVELITDIDTGCDLREEATKPQYGFAKAYRELYDSLQPGEERQVEIYIKDYYDYYPIGGHIDLPGRGIGDSIDGDEVPLLYADPTTLDEIELTFYKLQQFFKIPVLEEETHYISAGKSLNNSQAVSMGGGSTDSDRFDFYTYGVYTKDTAYFTFDPHSNKGVLMDTSLIPGGFGIYALPYTFEENTAYNAYVKADTDALAMVYPLDPTERVLEMSLSPDQSKLLLHQAVGNDYVVTVIDLATMETLQRIEAGRRFADNDYLDLYEGDDFFAAITDWGQRFTLFSIDENGEYQLEFSHQSPEQGDEEGFGSPWYLEFDLYMDFDGEKLIAADHDKTKEYGRNNSGFALMVYDKTGLLYFGEYQNSLGIGQNEREYNDYCRPIDGLSLTAEW